MGSFLEVVDKLPIIYGTIFVGLAYILSTIDRARANSLAKDDTQVGLKLVCYGLIISGIGVAVLGVVFLLDYMLSGFKGGTAVIKSVLPGVIVGVVTVLAVSKALLPRTNNATARQPERYFLGILAIQFGSATIYFTQSLLGGLFQDHPWANDNAMSLSGLVVVGPVAIYAIRRLGALSGWVIPPPMMPPQMQPPQQMMPPGGYGAPPGGYPPQGGGYGPPQGGGGYGPPSGGYPPQGGGGYGPPR